VVGEVAGKEEKWMSWLQVAEYNMITNKQTSDLKSEVNMHMSLAAPSKSGVG